MSSLQVIALISGGKDSFMSLFHCLKNGHQIVALANLHPADNADEDLDSFMYQTIGHRFLPLYEEAIGIPLYRQEIRGQAVDSRKTYASTFSDDETESLVPLLKRIIERHPNANAISSGAILSDYQRTRVENVAIRFKLIPLSYLWQHPTLFPQDPAALLRQMGRIGMDARIIKVASGGLDESFLWKNVADSNVIARLGRTINKHGFAGPGAILGEGGEFETIVLDGPDDIFKRRLAPDLSHSRLVNSGGGSSIMSFSMAGDERTFAKDEILKTSVENLVCPARLDRLSNAILHDCYPSPAIEDSGTAPRINFLRPPSNPTSQSKNYTERDSVTLARSNMFGPAGQPVEFQMQIILSRLGDWLRGAKLNSTNIVFSTLFLRRMSSFSAINKIYGDFFSGVNPPARVTVGCGDQMPPSIDILMNVVADEHHPDHSLTLHVQSRSYWAPANIGPYSQAVTVQAHFPDIREDDPSKGSLIYISGQIPLDPASMEIKVDESKSPLMNHWEQVILSLQHVYRVEACAKASGYEDTTTRPISVVAFLSGEEYIQERIVFCQRAWIARANVREAEVEEDDVDPWDKINRRDRHDSHESNQVNEQSVPQLSFGDDESGDRAFRLIVLVEELPRNAPIEWAALSWTGSIDNENEAFKSTRHHEFLTSSFIFLSGHMQIVTSLVPQEVPKSDDENLDYAAKILNMSRSVTRSLEFAQERSHQPCQLASFTTVYVDASLVDPAELIAISGFQVVPCKAVWSSHGLPLAAGIIRRLQSIPTDRELTSRGSMSDIPE